MKVLAIFGTWLEAIKMAPVVRALQKKTGVTSMVCVTGQHHKQSQRGSLGAGPGLTLRRWFRETDHKAPQSYIELTVQYRVRVSGDKRAEGVFASLTASF